ncbi:protein IWS1 homolog [Brassica napus]|uniref:protein IWS1 homolog n=1 Tax=Brassica napus TaxID=3708 RepID=UPI002078E9EA|nr:protein IWS1 homolog [Brassica napus]
MDGVPDLSALLKGKLQLLSKKSTTVDPQGPSNSGVNVTSEGGGTSREGASKEGVSREEGPIAIDQGGRAETSASGPKKKKKSKKTKVGATDEAPPKESASLDATSEGSKAKKKKDGRKRSRGGAASSVDRGEGLAEGKEAVLVGAAPDGHPKKRNKRSVEAEPRPSTSDANAADATLVDAVGEASGTPENLSEERTKTSSREGGSGGEPERSAPDSSARKRSGSEGSAAKRRRIEFPDRVEFSYDETTPLIFNPLRCAELTRQIHGGTKEMPQLEDLYFKNEYIDDVSSRARSDGSMNFLVEKYDSALKQTMIQLGSLEKLAQARLKAIERVRAEHKKANEKAAKEKEILRVKFKELEGKLKSASAAKKELARENTRLEQAAATLENEKTELLEERDAAVEKLIGEKQSLRDSRGLEITRERERVEAAMVEKNLHGQASGTKKCLEMIKVSGTEIPQEMIDVFAEQEKLYEAEATKFCVGPLSDSDLTLSLLVLPSRFVEDRFRASFDPYG